MAETVLQEWRDSNRSRVFPFAEDLTLTSKEHLRLRDDTFLDGIFYPINMTGVLFLSRLSLTDSVLTISDSVTGEVKGTGAIVSGAEAIRFYDGLNRHIGILVKGPAFDLLIGDNTFDVGATAFAPACVFARNQIGVRSIRLPDGAVLTGEVKFEGVDGVVLRIEDDAIALHAVGSAETPPDIQLGPPIKQIYISEVANSALTIGRDSNVIKVGHRVALADLDSSNDQIVGTAGELPPRADTKFGTGVFDPCVAPPPDPPPPVLPPTPPGVQEVVHKGFFYIVSVTDLISISPVSSPSIPTTIQGIDPEIIDLIARSLPPRDRQGLKFNMKDCRS